MLAGVLVDQLLWDMTSPVSLPSGIPGSSSNVGLAQRLILKCGI